MEEVQLMELTSGYDYKINRGKRPTKKYRTMTREEILHLAAGETVPFLANDGTCRNVKINGKVRTWKKDPNRVEVPVKYGMYEYHTFSLGEAMSRLLVLMEEDDESQGT